MNSAYKLPVLRYVQLRENQQEYKEIKSFGIPKDPYIPRPVKKKTLRKLKGKKQ